MSYKIIDVDINILPNIRLATLRENDSDALFAASERNRQYLRRWLPWLDSVLEPADSLNFISHNRHLAEQGKGVQFAIKVNNELVGIAGFHNRDVLYRQAELGYWLDEAYNGQGIMTQAVDSLICYGFDTLNLRKINIRCAIENAKSRKIPERLGFTLEGFRKRCEWLYDHYVDHAVYSLKIDNYSKQRGDSIINL